MKDPNRERKGEINFDVTLNEEQKAAKQVIIDNQITIITGRAGCGKSLLCAQTSLGFLMTKQCNKILVTRPTVEMGDTLGFLPGDLKDKYNPYLEAFQENLEQCYNKQKIAELIKEGRIDAFPVQFTRGKTIEDVLVVEEAQNLTKEQMLGILTRLGKTGKIIINGDNDQIDTHLAYTGLSYAIELSKRLDGIEWVKLKTNHRSDLVGQILDYEYDRKKLINQ